MRAKRGTRIPNAGLPALHQRVVEGILAQELPPRRRLSAPWQWALWMVLALAGVGLASASAGVHLWTEAPQERVGVFLFMGLGLAALSLASWEALASSIPGRASGPAFKRTVWAVLGLLALSPLLMPALGSPWGPPASLLDDALPCMLKVLALGGPPWLLLAWLLSRNASMSPARTGAWSGVAAFLVGTLGVQLGCPNTHPAHLIVAHLLPVAAAAGCASAAGKFWFSRWKR